MKKFLPILKKTRIFYGLTEGQIVNILPCLCAKLNSYKKGEYIFREGEKVELLSLIVKGEVHVQKDDYWGNRSIVNRIGVGDMFGESYLSAESGAINNDVIATEDCTVITFDLKKLMMTCSSACHFHSLVVQNLFFIIAEKNRSLVQKIGHITKRTTREKLMSYLSEQAKKTGRNYFDIPFNRQQLADFLSVDRSAMSNELCKMRDEGLLQFEKNHFRLL